jgi:hypothetical protein
MPSPIFPNGVSAGDTTQTDTVLWARSTVPGLVEFNLSTSPNFSDHVGQATASVVDPMIPVKVQISGLVPGTTYHYRATSATGVSETGRFETPAPDGTHAGLRFGVSGDGRGDLAPFPAIANADERGSMARRGRWSGCHGESRALIVVDAHARIPLGEQVGQRAVEGFGSGL